MKLHRIIINREFTSQLSVYKQTLPTGESIPDMVFHSIKLFNRRDMGCSVIQQIKSMVGFPSQFSPKRNAVFID